MAPTRLPGKAARSAEVYDHLKAAILSGDLAPGQRLVEQVVAKTYGVSRTPVREAVGRLHNEGLVRGDARGLSVIALTDAELLDLCIAREALEGVAARFASGHVTEVELQALEQIQEDTRVATEAGNIRRLIELNHAFHGAIWRAARNRFLAEELAQLRGLIERLQSTTLGRRERQWQALGEHRDLIDALRRGEAEAAEAVARGHFQRATALRLSQQSVPTTPQTLMPVVNGATVPQEPGK